MSDYLARADSPLSSETWDIIDKAVIESARKRLVGRKFIDIFGPIGAGAQVVQSPIFSSINDNIVEIRGRNSLAIQMIYKDFKLHWRDIESAKQYGKPLELAPATASSASAFCALKEDELIFNGNDDYGYKGLLNIEGSTKVEAQDWKVSGNAFQNVVSAIEALTTAGFYGPYAMIMSPSLYAKVHRVYNGTGALEIAMIRELITGGVFQSPVIKGEGAIVIATGMENLDLVIAQDMITAYLGPEVMDHLFRVFETIVLRIKRPSSICIFSVK